MAANTVNFFQPGTEAGIDANQILRQREMAKLMMQQGMQGQQGQMVSGHYVPPSGMSYVAQLANVLAGKATAERADERELALGKQLRAQNAAEAQQFAQALQGTPAQPGREIQPLTPNDDEGNAMPVAQAAGTPAVPGDVNRAIALAMQSQNPMVSGMAPELMKRQLDAAEFQQALQSAQGGPAGAPAAGGVAPAGGAPSGPAPGGNTFGLNPAAFALTASPNARAQALGKMVQENSKPITLGEAGTLIDPVTKQPIYTAPKTEAGIGVVPIAGSPGTFKAQPVEGYAEAKANAAGLSAGAVKKAEDPYAGLVRIGDRWLTPAQARAEAQGGSQPRSNPSPTEGVRGNFDTNNIEGLRAAIDRLPPQEAANARAALTEQLQRGQTMAVMPEAAAGRGGQGGPGIPVPSDEQKAYGEARAKDFAELAKTTQKGAQSAVGTLRNLDTLEALYKDPNVAKGGAAEGISNLKNIAVSMGVDVKGLGAEQGIAAITNKMALEARSTADGGGMPGAMSDADRDFLKALQPGLSKSPEGRATIIAASRAVAQRQVEVARLANEYERRNGRLDAGFDRELADFSNKNQMFAGQKAPSAPASNAPDFRSLAAQELARRRGGK